MKNGRIYPLGFTNPLLELIERRNYCPCKSRKYFSDCHGNQELTAQNKGQKIRRQDMWSIHYRQNRYLKLLTEEEMIQRGKDILENQIVLKTTQNGIVKKGLHKFEEDAEKWMRLYNDLQEECLLRGYKDDYQLLNELKDLLKMPRPTWPGLHKAEEAFNRLDLHQAPYLVKYGEEKYLRPMLEAGHIKISAASDYNEDYLNQAIKDDELKHDLIAKADEMRVILNDSVINHLDAGPINENIRVTVKSRSNFYVYCLANIFSLRLFSDFEADSCLIIKRPVEFIKALTQKFEETMPLWGYRAQPVSYYDPTDTSANDLKIGFSKHFRYEYQNEYRIVWNPPSSEGRLNPLKFELGDLREYCELITLTGK
jgi:hypothetical protein